MWLYTWENTGHGFNPQKIKRIVYQKPGFGFNPMKKKGYVMNQQILLWGLSFHWCDSCESPRQQQEWGWRRCPLARCPLSSGKYYFSNSNKYILNIKTNKFWNLREMQFTIWDNHTFATRVRFICEWVFFLVKLTDAKEYFSFPSSKLVIPNYS